MTTILLVIIGTATEFGGYTMLLVLPQRIEAGVITADIAIGIIQCTTIDPVIACRGFIQQHFSAPIDPRPGIQRLVDKQVIGPAAVIHIGIGGIRGLMTIAGVRVIECLLTTIICLQFALVTILLETSTQLIELVLVPGFLAAVTVGR